MRRSSVITIVILVLVIIGLIVALVVTNLPQEENNEVAQENNEALNNEETTQNVENETPTNVDLNSDIAVELADFVTPRITTQNFFYEMKKGSITFDDFNNQMKMIIAYQNIPEEKIIKGQNGEFISRITKQDLDEAMMKAFGKVEYEPENLSADMLAYIYDPQTETFTASVGGGGGPGDFQLITGTYKIEEYNDRYEVYDKLLMINSREIYNGGTTLLGREWDIRQSNVYTVDTIGTYRDFSGEEFSHLDTLDELLSGVEEKQFVISTVNAGMDRTQKVKLLSKYYDEATEYKHTFMKNDDGSFYWVKSEIVK